MITRRVLLWFFIILVLVVGLLPIIEVFSRTLLAEGHLTLRLYKDILASDRQWILLGRSLALAALTALAAILIGLPLGVILSKTDSPFRKLFTFLFTIPLLLPPYITAIAWFYLIGRQNWFFDLPGCVLILSITFFPIVMLLTMAYLRNINPGLEEAGKLSSGWTGILKSITIPMILPGILLGAILVFLLTLGEFSVPTFLRYNVFSVETLTQFTAFYDFASAAVSAIPLLFITGAVLLFEELFLRRRISDSYWTAVDHGRFLRIELKSSRKWILVLMSFACCILIGLPLIVLISQAGSITTFMQAAGKTSDALIRSLICASAGATLLTVIGFFLGYLIYTKTFPVWRGMDALTIVLLTLPSSLTGIGLISFWNHSVTRFIYGTPFMIILGYIACYIALTSRITVAALSQVSPAMEEAAQISGISWIRRICFIIAPLLKNGLLAAWLIAFLFCLRDTGVTMIVYPPGFDTLPVRLFTLMANGPSALVASLCMVMVLTILVPFGILGIFFREKAVL